MKPRDSSLSRSLPAGLSDRRAIGLLLPGPADVTLVTAVHQLELCAPSGHVRKLSLTSHLSPRQQQSLRQHYELLPSTRPVSRADNRLLHAYQPALLLALAKRSLAMNVASTACGILDVDAV